MCSLAGLSFVCEAISRGLIYAEIAVITSVVAAIVWHIATEGRLP